MEASEPSPLSGNAAQLQEAIDTIVQTFDHPDAISIEYTFVDGVKQTKFHVPTEDGETTYELVYDGQTDEAEPEFVQPD